MPSFLQVPVFLCYEVFECFASIFPIISGFYQLFDAYSCHVIGEHTVYCKYTYTRWIVTPRKHSSRWSYCLTDLSVKTQPDSLRRRSDRTPSVCGKRWRGRHCRVAQASRWQMLCMAAGCRDVVKGAASDDDGWQQRGDVNQSDSPVRMAFSQLLRS